MLAKSRRRKLVLAGASIPLILAITFLAATARAKKPGRGRCPTGTFSIDGALMNAEGAATHSEIVVGPSSSTIKGLCDTPVASRVKAKKKFDLVRAHWNECETAPSKVKLKARISADGCDTMTGLVTMRRSRPRKQRFTATRRPELPTFRSATECANCHPRQYREWKGSMMAYGAISPVANALEAIGNRFTGGAFAADGPFPLLCQGCHSPISVARQEFPDYADVEGRPSRDFLSDTGREGLSCDFCHQVAHADLEGSLLGDGIANAAFVLQTGPLKFGPFENAMPNTMHVTESSDYLRSSNFCGTCHDVRLPGEDAVTGEPFRRLEDAFTEWERSAYATNHNPFGRVVTCQDCHMSAYPYSPPGTYFVDRVAAVEGAPERRVATHYFTGVDVALVDFPGQYDEGLDAHGLPIGQDQRRRDLLRIACTLDLELPDEAQPGSTLPIVVEITNTGAGHNVPTGFSQERQMWIELSVVDGNGEVIYESGYLVDSAHPETGEMEPDGRLDDEDLENWTGTIDPWTLQAHLQLGGDRNHRPEKNLGLVNFGNEFVRVTASGKEEVFMPFLANSIDNTHSIPPLETVKRRYDVTLPTDAPGPLQISARLRFRPFPPRFLRALAVARPDLVDEALIDRNRIVDMAESSATLPLSLP